MPLVVPKIPLMDYVGRPLLACLFVALLWLQWRFPLRRQHFSMMHRLVRNFVQFPALPGPYGRTAPRRIAWSGMARSEGLETPNLLIRRDIRTFS